MSGAFKGMLVAFANTVVIALLIASEQRHPSFDFAVMVVAFGFIPATLFGAFIGHVAAALGRAHRGALALAMSAFACLCVRAIAEEFSANEYVVMACVPTLIGCLVLERWTRPTPQNPSQNLPEYVA